MGNCLVTKLKGVVDNDNLDYLGFVTLNFKPTQSIPVDNVLLILGGLKSNSDMQILTSGVSLFLNIQGGLSVAENALEANQTVKILLDKYKCTAFRNLNNEVIWDFAEITKFPNVTNLWLTGGNNGTWVKNNHTSRLNGNTKITKLEIDNDALRGNLSDIATMTQLTSIIIKYTHNIFGDLSLIKDLPNLTTVTLDHVQISDNEDTVTYLQNRGVTVTYVHD